MKVMWRTGQTLPDGRGSDNRCDSDHRRDSHPSRDREGAFALFDRIASRYDALWTTTAVGRAQRDLVWREIDTLFHAGERILDIGCGTGEDAAHFAARGVAVYATDAAPAMIEVARSRGVTAAVCPAEELARISGAFDGAISNFGALNCVEDLPAVARSLAELVRPGGRVAICLLGRFCAWETVYYTARLQFRKALRRWAGHAFACPGGEQSAPRADRKLEHAPPKPIAVYYPTASQLRAAFAPNFELQRWTGIGLFVPPSYVNLPAAVVGGLARCDRVLARLPLLRAMADHRLFLLVRK